MREYWSNTKFANWIRGTTKPTSATSSGWNKWEKEAKESHPIRYWIVEEGLDKIQTFVRLPIDTLYNVKYYINNRWVTRTHSLTAHPRDIKPGQWQDVGNRFLPCMFNELVDFVEVETAWLHIAWDDEAYKKYNPPFYAKGWFRWRTWRNPQAGLDHLDWAATLTYENADGKEELSSQATSAKEIKELYLWWTQAYRNRLDPHDASGWSAYCEKRRQKAGSDLWGHENETEEERKECMDALDLSQKIEAEHMEEDEAMLIRLIKIRQALWT